MPTTSQDNDKECYPSIQFGQFWPRVASVRDSHMAWYLTVYFGSRAANLLVDSGAQVSMVSKTIYDSLATNYCPKLKKCELPINAANGGQITTYGEATFSLGIARCIFSADIIVADMGGLAGVLGMDFLSNHDAVLHCKTGALEIGGKLVSCHGRRPDEGGQVSLLQTTTLKPGHVCFVDVAVEQWGKTSHMYNVVEPIAEVCNMEGILVPRSVINRSCGSITLELTNVSGSVRTLQKGLVLGLLDPVETVHDDTRKTDHLLTCSVDLLQDQVLPEHLRAMVDEAVDLNDSQKQVVSNLLLEFEHCFEGGKYGLGQTDMVTHKIDTGDHQPIKVPPRRLGWAQRRAMEEEVQKMLAKGVIEPSNSPWSSPPVLVRKKDGTFRFCIDYRKLNGIVRRDAFPLPRVDDCLDSLSGASWFCTLDLSSGYWQIAMDKEDKAKTAFSTPRGLFEFKVMPFGVKNGPATLERLMELVLSGMTIEQCLCYMDDVVVCGPTFGTTVKNLREVLCRLSQAGLRLKPKKCELFKSEVSFLGHVVGKHGVKPDPRKIEVIQQWPTPANIHELRSFIGFASYYRKYVRDFAGIAAPLNVLTQKDTPFKWNSACQKSFETLKNALISSPVMPLPREGCQVILDTDASDFSVGGVLSQIIDGEEKVIAFASKSLNSSQRKYCTTYKELLAIVKMAKIFRPYLYGQPNVIVRTDHKALIWLQNFKDAEGMLARWLSTLTEYDFNIVHREGRKHGNADGCSRIPIRSCKRPDCPDKAHVLTGSSPAEICETQVSAAASQLGTQTELTHASELDHHNPVSCMANQQRPANWLETLSEQQLKSSQTEDRNLAQVKAWLEEGERPAFETLNNAEAYLKNLWAQFNCLKLCNGKVVRTCKLPCGEEVTQLVVPPALRKEIFGFLHSSPLGGHMGINKTIAKIRKRFYWPSYRDDIIRWCQWCEPCQKRKDSTQKRAPLQQKPVGNPLERVAIDILGPLPETETKNKYIMVVADYFTKWTEAYALPDQKSMTIADALVTNFIVRFGCPLQLHTDQGPSFEADLFQDICKLLGIHKTRTCPYRPNSDGLVERFNRSVQDMLAKLVNSDRTNWDDLLPYVMCAYRATPHESTGVTPNRMMLGRESDLPVDLVFGREVPDERDCHIDYVE